MRSIQREYAHPQWHHFHHPSDIAVRFWVPQPGWIRKTFSWLTNNQMNYLHNSKHIMHEIHQVVVLYPYYTWNIYDLKPIHIQSYPCACVKTFYTHIYVYIYTYIFSYWLKYTYSMIRCNGGRSPIYKQWCKSVRLL